MNTDILNRTAGLALEVSNGTDPAIAAAIFVAAAALIVIGGLLMMRGKLRVGASLLTAAALGAGSLVIVSYVQMAETANRNVATARSLLEDRYGLATEKGPVSAALIGFGGWFNASGRFSARDADGKIVVLGAVIDIDDAQRTAVLHLVRDGTELNLSEAP